MALKPPVEVPQGAIRLNTDSQKLEFYAQDQWWEMATDVPTLDGGARGVFAGSGPSPATTMDYITISRDPKANFLKKVLYALKYSTSLSAIFDRLSNSQKIASIKEELSSMFQISTSAISNKIYYVEHHRSHIAASFFASSLSLSIISLTSSSRVVLGFQPSLL